jgi:hypothetical protein
LHPDFDSPLPDQRMKTTPKAKFDFYIATPWIFCILFWVAVAVYFITR